MTASTPVNPCCCPLCGQANACAMAAAEPDATPSTPCWCTRVHFSAELLQRVPAVARDKACICAACVQSAPLGSGRVPN